MRACPQRVICMDAKMRYDADLSLFRTKITLYITVDAFKKFNECQKDMAVGFRLDISRCILYPLLTTPITTKHPSPCSKHDNHASQRVASLPCDDSAQHRLLRARRDVHDLLKSKECRWCLAAGFWACWVLRVDRRCAKTVIHSCISW